MKTRTEKNTKNDIYIWEFPNGKYYIGCTSVGYQQRRAVHNWDLKTYKETGYCKQPKLMQALDKFGIDSPKVIIINYPFNYSKYFMNLVEEYYISKHNAVLDGYNACEKGSTHPKDKNAKCNRERNSNHHSFGRTWVKKKENECPHCLRLFSKSAMTQFHGDKCKLKPKELQKT